MQDGPALFLSTAAVQPRLPELKALQRDLESQLPIEDS